MLTPSNPPATRTKPPVSAVRVVKALAALIAPVEDQLAVLELNRSAVAVGTPAVLAPVNAPAASTASVGSGDK